MPTDVRKSAIPSKMPLKYWPTNPALSKSGILALSIKPIRIPKDVNRKPEKTVEIVNRLKCTSFLFGSVGINSNIMLKIMKIIINVIKNTLTLFLHSLFKTSPPL